MTKLRAWRCFSVVMVMVLILGVAAIAVPTVPVRADEGTWNIQTVDDIDVNSTSLALDSNGYPHISYTTGLSDSLYYARWTGTSWEKEMVDDVAAGVTSLALDSQDRPHICYTTGGLDSLLYAHWTGVGWAKETVDIGFVTDCSLALDGQDRPHVSYSCAAVVPASHDNPHVSDSDAGFPNLRYAYRTGATWNISEVPSEHPVLSCSLALDSHDRPHISYATFDIGDASLHYTHWTGSHWDTETVDEDPAVATSLALDSHGYPHISYTTADLLGSLHYASRMGAGWIKRIVDPDAVSDCSLALDSHDRPHISYFVGTLTGLSDGLASESDDEIDITVTGMLKYAYWTGSAWDIETVDEEQETIHQVVPTDASQIPLRTRGKWSSIALDSYDLPHISYGNLVFVHIYSLHYAHLIPPDTATVNTATGTGTATFHTSAGGIVNLTAADNTLCGTLSGFTFPHGFFSFIITDILAGSTVTITIALPSNMPTDTQYWKCINGQWVDATSILGDNDGDNILTLTITDGSQFDADGQVNSTIVDPGGPAVIVVKEPTLQTPPPVKPRVSLRNPASMSVQYLGINPQQVYGNQSVTITANVVNTGDQTGSLNVVLKINGNVEQTKLVSVGPQGTQPVKFTVTKAQPGTYAVDIGGQQGSFTILGAVGSRGTSSSDRMIGILFIIGVLVLAAAVVVWLLIRRPA
jgi:hypothetical protein